MQLVPVLFRRTLDRHQMGFAFGDRLLTSTIWCIKAPSAVSSAATASTASFAQADRGASIVTTNQA